MTLENLLAIRRLIRHETERAAILKLLTAAERNLADARVASISAAIPLPRRGRGRGEGTRVVLAPRQASQASTAVSRIIRH
jgi:hypothetical protein